MDNPEQSRVGDVQGQWRGEPTDTRRTGEDKPYRGKVFKSGNSMALRLPAGLGLEAGIEMDLTPDGLGGYKLRRADAPKRKFNIAKVAGCAIGSGLQPIKDGDRVFAERALLWDDPEWRAKHMPGE